ncbi:MAG: amidohydrolase family protein, partial [Alphaproteobacteria bacterium]|nr:amidohydrolase family protein [Alphaproteobacteria bacterium]
APLDLAVEVAEELGLPVMTHIDTPPPSRREVLDRLRPGDILTHCFRPFPNAPIDRRRALRTEVREARERGIIFDIGHGKGSFAFPVGRAMLEQGFLPDVISSDVHSLSARGPAVDLAETMSKFTCLGMGLVEVIAAVTAGPARALRRPDLGTLRVGAVGDATVFELREGRFTYVDAPGEHMVGTHRIAPRLMVVGGRLWHEAPAAPSA